MADGELRPQRRGIGRNQAEADSAAEHRGEAPAGRDADFPVAAPDLVVMARGAAGTYPEGP